MKEKTFRERFMNIFIIQLLIVMTLAFLSLPLILSLTFGSEWMLLNLFTVPLAIATLTIKL